MMSLEKWLELSISNLAINSTKLSSIQQFLPELHDFSTTIILEEREFHGRGTKENEDLALKISLVEAIERIIVRQNKVSTTNGVAAHLIENIAKEKAKFELIERDLFLSHFITMSPFKHISTDNIIPFNIIEYIEKNFDEISFYKMRPTNLGSGYVCVISGRIRWGGLFGLSFGTNSEHELLFAAFLEAFRQYTNLRSSNKLNQSLSLDAFNQLNTWDFTKHSLLSRNVDYFAKISHLFKSNCENESVIFYNENEFTFTELKSGIAPFDIVPLYIIRCLNSNCQKLYVGPMKETLISKSGLIRFLGHNYENLNLLPHPIN